MNLDTTTKILIKSNNDTFNLLKLSEELNELNTEIVKYITRGNKGDINKIAQESADVKLRLNTVIKIFNIEALVDLHLEKKSDHLMKKHYANKLGKKIIVK